VFITANICANGTVRKLEQNTGISASNENEEELKWSIGRIAF